ncbi:uncharacterized protein [Phaseolus vulgaris]|uniref:uncharacterized protein n=1 Tax=Phaseolus vulgaris TaxID=3885 RepID=UPI0035CC99B3
MERGFKELVQEKWMSYSTQGNDMIKLKDKLKMLKNDLKVWNMDVFGNIDLKKSRILKRIEEVDCQDAYGKLEGSSRLERMELEEVQEAVWRCDGSKSPGPYGYNFNFIKKSWDVIKSDIVAVVAQFHDSSSIPKGCNASFIALVPKVSDPLKLDQYRPITLVSALYKIISKVLSCRIKSVLPSVIDGSHSAFLMDRGMLDSVLMANEVVEELRRDGRSLLFLKVDYKKKSTEEFKPTRGLRQGDHLAPFLFIIVAEGLAELAKQAIKANALSGLKIGRNAVEVCVLQLADDTLFLCEDSFRNVITMKAILRGYELASGLKINFHKSKVAGINVERNALDLYAKTLNCTQMSIPFKYLGLEVGGNPRKIMFWEPILRKLKAKLSAWKGRFLSLAGRICLIKFVLSALPLFYLAFYKAPEFVLASPASKGGSCGRGGRKKEQYHGWCLLIGEKGKWRDLLVSKYGSAASTPVKLQSWWSGDLSKVCHGGGGGGWFQEATSLKIGASDKVRFWKDVWVGNLNLKTVFPRLHSLSLNQGEKVGEAGVWVGSEWRWSLRWRCARFVWESIMEEDLLRLISQTNLYKKVKGYQVWRNEESGMFLVKSAYDHLTNPVNSNQNLVWKGIWAIIVRCIWDHRNNVIFKQGAVNAEEIFHMELIVAAEVLSLSPRIPQFPFHYETGVEVGCGLYVALLLVLVQKHSSQAVGRKPVLASL